MARRVVKGTEGKIYLQFDITDLTYGEVAILLKMNSRIFRAVGNKTIKKGVNHIGYQDIEGEKIVPVVGRVVFVNLAVGKGAKATGSVNMIESYSLVETSGKEELKMKICDALFEDFPCKFDGNKLIAQLGRN